MVDRRTHFHNLSFLRMHILFAADSAIRTDRLRARLLRFVPGSCRAHVVFDFAHQRSRGTHANTVPAVHARRFRQRNFKFRGNVRVEPASRHANRERVLRIHAAGFHAFVAKDALCVVAHVKFVVDFRRLRNRGRSRTEFLCARSVAFHVIPQLRRRRHVHGRREEFQHHAPAQANALRIRANHHAGFYFSRTRRHQRPRAFEFHDAHAANVHGRQRFEKTERRRFNPEFPRGIQNGRAFGNTHGLAIDRDFNFTARPGCRNLRHGRAWNWNQWGRRLELFAHKNRLHRSIAERIAPEAVCPSPQMEASRIACAISFSSALSCSCEPIGLRCTKRCNASSCRIVPTRHGTHCPQVSLRKNAAMRSKIFFSSTESSNNITTPEPSVAPIARVPSNVSGVSSSFGETKLPAAPPSNTAWSRPVPPTPPAISMTFRIVGPNGTSYTPGRPTCPETQNKRYPEEFAVPMRAYAAPLLKTISGTLTSVSTLFTTVGWRNNPLCVGNGGLLRGSPR